MHATKCHSKKNSPNEIAKGHIFIEDDEVVFTSQGIFAENRCKPSHDFSFLQTAYKERGFGDLDFNLRH